MVRTTVGADLCILIRSHEHHRDRSSLLRQRTAAEDIEGGGQSVFVVKGRAGICDGGDRETERDRLQISDAEAHQLHRFDREGRCPQLLTTKNTAIDVIARNECHQQYLQSLINQTGKYKFDVTSTQFLNLYYDTILRLCERGFLFEDDPELEEVRSLMSQQKARTTQDASGCVSVSVYPDSNITQRLTTRNRVIFPYLRRLLETQKAALVTKRRVDFLNDQIQPDEEIRRAFQEKFEETMRVRCLSVGSWVAEQRQHAERDAGGASQSLPVFDAELPEGPLFSRPRHAVASVLEVGAFNQRPHAQAVYYDSLGEASAWRGLYSAVWRRGEDGEAF